MGEHRGRITRTSGMISRRAGCGESCTSGSEGGLGKPVGGDSGTAPQSDPYTHSAQFSVMCSRGASAPWSPGLASGEAAHNHRPAVRHEALVASGLAERRSTDDLDCAVPGKRLVAVPPGTASLVKEIFEAPGKARGCPLHRGAIGWERPDG